MREGRRKEDVPIAVRRVERRRMGSEKGVGMDIPGVRGERGLTRIEWMLIVSSFEIWMW